MAGRSSPIDIATQSRNVSASPQHRHSSNLTFALQSTTGNELRPSSAMSINGGNGKVQASGRHDSLTAGMPGFGSQYSSGAIPISMNNSNRDKPRRESLAGSMVGGMSWGGTSVGSWIRDDIIMQGTSPFVAYQSPSFHSSSYLPKLEANFMKDFECCGTVLPSLHDLLQHYEEAHAQQIPPPVPRQQSMQKSEPPDSKAAAEVGAAAVAQQQCQQQQEQEDQQRRNPLTNGPTPTQHSTIVSEIPRNSQQHPHFQSGELTQQSLQPEQDMDAVEHMDMDDFTSGNMDNLQPSRYSLQGRTQIPPRPQFGQSARVPPLDLGTLNFGSPLQTHQGLRKSQPTTPVSGGRPGGMYQNNPTVSSVNTPTLSTHPLQQQYRNTPDSSAPGTPGELDGDLIGDLDDLSMANSQQQFLNSQQQAFGGFEFDNAADMLDLCIDEPAKRLWSPNGGYGNPRQTQSKLGSAQYGPNSEIARTIREQQMRAGLPDTVSGTNGEEPKPFRCPVIGCEKAYKNQNGLKYHKSHGHNNQQLHENADGTFSIVDPATSTPYPGTLGMEKEKPYKCEVCGKRYKNLNGLKYHKSHSPQCNVDIKLAPGMHAPFNATSMNVNIAGAGLAGIGEEMAQ